jgi:hypothetical protein
MTPAMFDRAAEVAQRPALSVRVGELLDRSK